ncbi:hypothetical protein D3C77_734020 [compost metagenome]
MHVLKGTHMQEFAPTQLDHLRLSQERFCTHAHLRAVQYWVLDGSIAPPLIANRIKLKVVRMR